jgi:hypothetical protein
VEPGKPVGPEPAEPPKPAEPEPGDPAKPGEEPKTEPPKPKEPVTEVEGKPGVYQVNDVSALKASEPVRVRFLWRWELYVELPNGQRAVFCEVNLRPSPYGGTSPDLNLHPKAATVQGGAPVELLSPPGVKWTTEALKLTIESHKAKFGAPPRNMGGWLAKSNLRNFQDAFARLRAENPGLSNEMLGEMAIKEISFGKQRMDPAVGYKYFKVTVAKVGKVKLTNGNVETVPTAVRVEATAEPFKPDYSPKFHPPDPEPPDQEGEDGE